MWRTTLAAVFLWSASSVAHAQEAALSTAIQGVCAPYVLDETAEAEIAALRDAPRLGDHRRLGDEVSVHVRMLGNVRVCSVMIDTANAERYRAAVLEAAPRWQIPLTYRGDIPPGIGFIRHEVFCADADGAQASWSLLSRNSGTDLTLAVMSAVTRHCSG